MPPNSTQNLNARLSLVTMTPRRPSSPAPSLTPPPIQTSAPPVQIVGEPAPYRGGYHLSF
jgi:hypothetical protein